MQTEAYQLNVEVGDLDLFSDAPLTLVEEKSVSESAYLASLGAPVAESEPFYPDTPEKIDWVFKIVSEAEARAIAERNAGLAAANAYRDLADGIEARANARAEEYLRRVQPLMRMFGQTIARMGEALLAASGKKGQTFALTYGAISFKKNAERFKFAKLRAEDEERAVAWAQAHAKSAVTNKPVLSRTLLKDLLQVQVDKTVVESTGEEQTFVKVLLGDVELPDWLIEIKPEKDVAIETQTKWEGVSL